MTFPLVLPDWLPWWAVLLAAIPLLIYVILLLLMPFSVFGVKDRLDLIDSRLEDLQGELRLLSLRLTAPPPDPDRGYVPPPRQPGSPRAPDPSWDDELPDLQPRGTVERPPPGQPAPARRPSDRPLRTEPRLGWPR